MRYLGAFHCIIWHFDVPHKLWVVRRTKTRTKRESGRPWCSDAIFISENITDRHIHQRHAYANSWDTLKNINICGTFPSHSRNELMHLFAIAFNGHRHRFRSEQYTQVCRLVFVDRLSSHNMQVECYETLRSLSVKWQKMSVSLACAPPHTLLILRHHLPQSLISICVTFFQSWANIEHIKEAFIAPHFPGRLFIHERI